MPETATPTGSDNPVIRNCVHCLAHVPDLVRYGSKPRRDIVKDSSVEERLMGAQRSFEDALRYPPNQTVIGNLGPEDLAAIPRPWFERERPDGDDRTAIGPFGEIVSQDIFYAFLESADILTPPLVSLEPRFGASVEAKLKNHPVLSPLAKPGEVPADSHAEKFSALEGLPLWSETDLLGCMRRDDRAEGREDDNLDALTLLEALCTKTSGAIALQWLLHREGIAPADIDYVISCGEEAAGDRYQRGGGGMAKSIAEMCGCTRASGMDVKNFCAAPASALVTAGALVKSGLYRRVAVVAGGSLAKLGMKYRAFLDAGMPILGDCLGATAFLVTPDDGQSPILHLEPGSVGLASVGSSTSDEAIYRDLIRTPLGALGLTMGDIDRYAPELHNPEIMEHSGSGDVVHKNYRLIAAMAVMAGEITKSEMEPFIERVGMVGFAPPQGHIPSAIPYMGHAMAAMRQGDLHRVMFLCKASLFLNRLTTLYDGVSFVLEANPAAIS